MTDTPRPRFAGLVRGELIKVRRQRMTWLLALLAAALVALAGALTVVEWNVRGASHRPADVFGQQLQLMARVVSSGCGILMLAITARAVAQDFQDGTIRLFVGHGVGRVQLMLAKLAAAGVTGAVALAASSVAGVVVSAVLFAALEGGLGGLGDVPASTWRDALLALAAAAISLAGCALIGFAVAGIGRSMVFGIAGALIALPADNLLNQLLTAVGASADWVRTIASYQLGFNLSALAPAFASSRPVSALHALLTTAVYGAVLLAVPLVLVRRLDVHE
jgi:ABC-2 type transport system permease protein